LKSRPKQQNLTKVQS